MTLQEMVDESRRIVFFGGAGVSTESGIPDFRSVDGLYHQQYDYPPETILSHTFYMQRPEEFYRFYRAKMLAPEEVEILVGHAIGGVCPFGVKEGVKVYLDVSLRRFESVYPACGSSNSAVELTLSELETASGSEGWIDVCK